MRSSLWTEENDATITIPLHSQHERVDVDPMRRAAGFLWTIGFLAFFLAGCQTVPPKNSMAARIAAEPPGDYYIGRRYFKPDFKVWGYIRKPGEPWRNAKLVMLNEKQKLAPDRERLSFGSDNNYEYKLQGYFSGEPVYEPASNTVYPEFVLKGYEVISTNPPPIFKSQKSGSAQTATSRYTIEKPE